MRGYETWKIVGTSGENLFALPVINRKSKPIMIAQAKRDFDEIDKVEKYRQSDKWT